MLQFVLISLNTEDDAAAEKHLNDDEIVIGRNFLSFKCSDPRISRNHGLLIRNERDVLLKSTHTNPLFFKIGDSATVRILQREDQVVLSHNDTFGLLQEQFWYRIEVRDPEGDVLPVLRVRTFEELSSARPDIPNNDFPEVPLNTAEPSTRRPNENGSSPSPKRARCSSPDTSASTDVQPSSTVETAEAVGSSSAVPEVKQEVPEEASSATNSNPVESSSVTVKQEEPENSAINSSSSDQPKPAVKTEEADSSVPRASCQFGIRCYRHGADHREELAHPGDADYRRPSFPPAVNAPPCPYGASCYRRNPAHFAELSHPDSSRPTVGAIQALPAFPASALQVPDNEEDEPDDDLDDFSAEESDADFEIRGLMSSTDDDDLDDGEVNEE